MKFEELPQETQAQLKQDRTEPKNKCVNTAYRIELYNEQGTRYFEAHRLSQPWGDNKGHSMPFGGGSYWVIAYGSVQFYRYRNCCGGVEYELCNGKRFGKSVNGTMIPQRLDTKKEVIELVKQIGIFTLEH